MRLARQRWGFGRPVLFFGSSSFFDRFIRRNDPLEAVALAQRALDKIRFIGYERQRGAQEIGSVFGHGFLHLATLDSVDNFREARIGRTQLGDAWIILLDQSQ